MDRDRLFTMEDDKQRSRATAYKVPVLAILNGKYVKEGEEFSPNYVLFGDKKISRVNLIGFVVSSENSGNSFELDDGTGKINVRAFEQMPQIRNLVIGDIVNLIGRIREFGNERYIVPEIVKKTTQEWMMVRKKENGLIKADAAEEIKEDISEEIVDLPADSILACRDKILQFVRDHDSGKGVDTEEIIKDAKISNCEKVVEDMLKEGEIFETMPGIVKVLE
jgi:hypothetical protein